MYIDSLNFCFVFKYAGCKDDFFVNNLFTDEI